MTYYAGLDVSLRSTNICVVDDQGELLAEGKTDTDVADIVGFLDELDVDIAKVGLEAGTLTQFGINSRDEEYWTQRISADAYCLKLTGSICHDSGQLYSGFETDPTFKYAGT